MKTILNIKNLIKRAEDQQESDHIKYNRRSFLGVAGLSISAVELLSFSKLSAKPREDKSQNIIGFDHIKQIDAGLLNIGYADLGPKNGPVVILLHGWPYDIHSFAEVAPILATAGYRVIVPHLRGHGTTTFLSPNTFRNGQQSVVALDIIALMDALKIKKATFGGYDWGARTADIIAALWPERCEALISAGGYLINSLERNKQPLPPKAEWGWWYQYYFATDRGVKGYTANKNDFNKLIWKNASPKWNFDEATFNRSALSFENPDYVAIVIHNYRWRLSLEEGESKYNDLENRLAAGPVITVPSITLDGGSDGIAVAGNGSAYAKKFSGKHVHKIISGAGHNVPQEAPDAFAQAIIEAYSYVK